MKKSKLVILKKDKSIDYNTEADMFLNELDKANKEHDVQKYIKDNKKWFIPGALFHNYNFGHHEAMIIPEFHLGEEYIADYLLIGRNSIGRYLVFVEFENVNVEICLKTSNAFTDDVRKGITQIKDWKRWIAANKEYMVRNTELAKWIDLPLQDWRICYCLVVGRRSLNNDMAKNLRGEEEHSSGISIVTYDRIVDKMRLLVNGF